MAGGGCCTGGDEGIGVMLLERALVFLDMAFLSGIEDVLLTFFSKIDLALH